MISFLSLSPLDWIACKADLESEKIAIENGMFGKLKILLRAIRIAVNSAVNIE